MLCLKLKQTSCGNVKRRTHCTHYETYFNPVSLISANKKRVTKLLRKSNPYHQGVRKYRNTSVYPVDRTPKNARMKYSCLQSGSHCGVPAREAPQVYVGIFITDASIKCPRFRCMATGAFS